MNKIRIMMITCACLISTTLFSQTQTKLIASEIKIHRKSLILEQTGRNGVANSSGNYAILINPEKHIISFLHDDVVRSSAKILNQETLTTIQIYYLNNGKNNLVLIVDENVALLMYDDMTVTYSLIRTSK